MVTTIWLTLRLATNPLTEITKSQAQLDLQTKQDDLLFIDSESLLPPDPDYLLELRGVIPHHSEYYFFAASVDPTDHDVGVEDDGRPLRWWEVKIRRSGSSEPDYQVVEEVNIIRVLTATKSSYGRYTLVYANQPATRGYGVSQLPTDLRSFVDKDNRVFFEEMGDYPSLQRAAAGASTDSTRAPLGTISGNRRYQGSRKSESLPVSGAAEVQPPPLPARAPPNIPSTTRRSKSRTTQDSDGFSGSQMDLARSESRRLLPGFLGGQRYTGDADVEMEDAPKGG